MSSRKTTYFPLPQRIISKYDFCRRHHAMENRLKTPVFSRFRAVGPGLLSGSRRAPCEP